MTADAPVTDEQLIRSVANGDPSCLATLFERHHEAVFRYYMRMLGNRAQSEDLVQELFLKLLRKAKGFRGDGSFRGWMFNIARNSALDHLRRSGRQQADSLDDLGADRQPGAAHTTENLVSGEEKVGLVLQALQALPVAAQEVIWLGRFELDSYEELGQALDCNPGAARVRMHRAMALLNSTFESMHGVTVDG